MTVAQAASQLLEVVETRKRNGEALKCKTDVKLAVIFSEGSVKKHSATVCYHVLRIVYFYLWHPLHVVCCHRGRAI